jgi:hypothetical protein
MVNFIQKEVRRATLHSSGRARCVGSDACGCSAQGAPDERPRFTDEFVDEDFCGTGATV